MYKKISRINYSGKVFDIYFDGFNQKRFLGVKIINGEEKYFCPNLEEYKALNNIYNSSNNKVLYSKYDFAKKMILTNSIIITFFCGAKLLDVDINLVQNDNNYELAISFQNEDDYIIISDRSQLDMYGINSVTFDDVRYTLLNNNKISDKYKNYVNEYIDVLEERMPNIDLRVLNENLKELQFEVIDVEDWDKDGVDAYFSFKDNPPTITVKSEYDTEEREKVVMTHELIHATRDGIISTNNSFKTIRVCFFNEYGYGMAINEGLTDVLTDYLLCDNYNNFFEEESRCDYSYEYSKYIYQILKDNKDYTFYDFINYDISRFIKVLEKYDVVSLAAAYDVDLINDRNNIERDQSLSEEYQQKLLIEICRNKIANGETEWNMYNLPYPFTTEMVIEAYNSIPYQDNWTVRLTDKSEIVYEKVNIEDTIGNNVQVNVTNTDQKVTLYYDNDIVYNGSINDVYFAHIYNNDKIVVRISTKENETYYDVVNSDILYQENIQFIDKFPTFGFNGYNMEINLNTLMNSDMYKQLYGDDIELYSSEYKDNKILIKH